jgi:hypothetical protein
LGRRFFIPDSEVLSEESDSAPGYFNVEFPDVTGGVLLRDYQCVWLMGKRRVWSLEVELQHQGYLELRNVHNSSY